MLSRLFGRRTASPAPVPETREALLGAARARIAEGQVAAAEIHLERLLERFPGDAEVYNELGRVKYAQGDFAQAEGAFGKAVEAAPHWPDALANLGQSFQVRGRFAEAARHFALALKRDPKHFAGRFNLALAKASLGENERALQLVRPLLKEAADDPTVHVLLGECLLRAGRFADGWREYEWRMRVEEYAPLFRHYPQEPWAGEEIPDATVLIWPEQGYGDMLQFMRLAQVAARQHPRMRFVLEVQPALGRLAQISCADLVNLQVVTTGSKLPAFDRHISIMSLPGLFSASLGANPVSGPYLRAPADAPEWAARVKDVAGATLAVGLVWGGNRREQHSAADQAVDVRRSVGAQAMLALLDVPDCTFFNLQVGNRAGEMAALGGQLVDFTGELGDFASSAALIAGLDLVISVDTSVVHLAGGLGKPVWMLSRFDCCWRWGRRAPDSAWYPQLRAFYQPQPGDWTSVVAKVRQALAEAAIRRGSAR